MAGRENINADRYKEILNRIKKLEKLSGVNEDESVFSKKSGINASAILTRIEGRIILIKKLSLFLQTPVRYRHQLRQDLMVCKIHSQLSFLKQGD